MSLKAASKHLADHLRAEFPGKVSSSHAHELVAAFLGFKTHAALLASEQHPDAWEMCLRQEIWLDMARERMRDRRVKLGRDRLNMPTTSELVACAAAAMREYLRKLREE